MSSRGYYQKDGLVYGGQFAGQRGQSRLRECGVSSVVGRLVFTLLYISGIPGLT